MWARNAVSWQARSSHMHVTCCSACKEQRKVTMHAKYETRQSWNFTPWSNLKNICCLSHSVSSLVCLPSYSRCLHKYLAPVCWVEVLLLFMVICNPSHDSSLKMARRKASVVLAAQNPQTNPQSSLFCSLLITSEGHIKLTDFGLSKIGLVNCESPNI